MIALEIGLLSTIRICRQIANELALDTELVLLLERMIALEIGLHVCSIQFVWE